VAQEGELVVSPEQHRPEEGRAVRERYSFSMWQGGLPMPADLARYEEWYPGITKVLMDERVTQGKHRRDLERRVVFAGTNLARAGLACGTVFLLSIVGLCFFAVAHGQQASAILLAVAAILGAVGAYVYGQRQQREERQEKTKEIAEVLSDRPQE
jgi:uncharacterized membrane protein